MKFETIRSKKKILLIGIILFCVGVTLILATSLAAYKKESTIKIAEGTLNYIIPDMKIVAINVENGVDEEGNQTYESSTTIPTSGYYLGDKSTCYVNQEELLDVSINYDGTSISIDGLTEKNTKCYIYLDKIPENVLTTNDVIANSTMGIGIPNFSNTSCKNGCDEATVGLYSKETRLGTTYYYRGDVEDNYVEFAGFYWRIIRINENGSLRLIYSGKKDEVDAVGKEIVLANGYDDLETDLKNADDPAYSSPLVFNTGYSYENVGFMLTYGQIKGNEYSSWIKDVLDFWYESNLANYSQYIDTESGFCGDRTNSGFSVNEISGTCYVEFEICHLDAYEGIDNYQCYETQTDFPTSDKLYCQNLSDSRLAIYDFVITDTYYQENQEGHQENQQTITYGAYTRLWNDSPDPTFECPDSTNDLYTINNKLNIGNEKLKYPIGLITADEVAYAGGISKYNDSNTVNENYYLYTDYYYWTISPSYYDGSFSPFVMLVGSKGQIDMESSHEASGNYLPVINLSPKVLLSGTGTIQNPYEVVGLS